MSFRREQQLFAGSRLRTKTGGTWDGVQVDVPWAAYCDSMSKRKGTWLGTIVDCDLADEVLDSTFTIEAEDDEEMVVCIDGHELAARSHI
jgi:hypothetical protein